MTIENPPVQKPSLVARLTHYNQTLQKANEELATGNHTAKLKTLLATMEDLGNCLERKKEKKEKRIHVCHLRINQWKKIERVCFFLAFISLLAGGISEGINYYKQNDAKTLSPMLYAGTVAIALFVLSELGRKIYESAKKIWSKEVESLQRELDETLAIHRTLQTMKIFLEGEHRKESKVKKIAKDIQETKLPTLAKRRWIRAGIKALDPDSSLRKRMEKAEVLADQILEDKNSKKKNVRKAKMHHKPSDDTYEEGPPLLDLDEAVESGNVSTPNISRKTKSDLCKVMKKLNNDLAIDGLCSNKALFDNSGKVEPIIA